MLEEYISIKLTTNFFHLMFTNFAVRLQSYHHFEKKLLLSLQISQIWMFRNLLNLVLNSHLIQLVKKAFRTFLFKKFYGETIVKQLWQFFFDFFAPILILFGQEIVRYFYL